MEAVLLIGIPAAGKTSFFRKRFQETHIHISLDVLGTRERESIALNACLKVGQAFVIDNTNISAAGRAVYIQAARAAGFRVMGYYLDVDLRTAIGRNKHRSDKKPLPVPAILRALKQLEIPRPEEQFDALFRVSSGPEETFDITDCALPPV